MTPRGAEFIEAAAPIDEELHALLHTVIARLMKMLTRRGVLVEVTGQSWLAKPDADGEEARTLRPLQAAAITYRIAFGPHAGQKVLTLRGATPRETRVVECWRDDVPDGKLTDFRLAVRATAEEAAVFACVEWPDKTMRDAGTKKMMDAPRMDPTMPGNPPMPFDGKRMIFDGFGRVLEVKA